MFLGKTTRSVTKEGQQVESGKYLILFGQAEGVLYAAVRRAKLAETGHRRIGRVRIGDSWVVVEGNYGDNGLPCPLDSVVAADRELLLQVPPELTELFWEANSRELLEWAQGNLAKLTRE